jgi:hypothetical protein
MAQLRVEKNVIPPWRDLVSSQHGSTELAEACA